MGKHPHPNDAYAGIIVVALLAAGAVLLNKNAGKTTVLTSPTATQLWLPLSCLADRLRRSDSHSACSSHPAGSACGSAQRIAVNVWVQVGGTGSGLVVRDARPSPASGLPPCPMARRHTS